MSPRLGHHRPVRSSTAGRTGTPGRNARGATLLEAAFALPIFLMLFMGLADVGFAALQTSQATSGAADGGRAGIVLDELPDTSNCASDPGYQRIVRAVQARIPGRELTCDHVEVECTRPDGTAINCTSANTLRDRMKVTVRWDWTPVSPAGHTLPIDEIVGTANMKFVPQPTPAPTATSSIPLPIP